MALMRKRSVSQMQELFSKCKSTDIGLKTQHMWNAPNLQYCKNPFNGGKIDTIEDQMNIENESRIESFSQFNEAALARESSIKQLKKVSKGSDIGTKTAGEYCKTNAYKGKKSIKGKVDTINKQMKIQTEDILSFSQFGEINEGKIDYINNALELSDNEKAVSKVRKHINNLIDGLPEDKKKDYKKNDWKHGVKLISKELGKEELNKLHKMVEDEVLTEPVKEGNEEYANPYRLNSVRDFSHWKDQPQNLRERGVMMGFQVEVGDIKGHVNRIKDNKVYIASTNGIEEVVSLKQLLKAYKPGKEGKKVHGLEIQGPSNTSVSKVPEEIKKSVVSPEIDDKSDVAKDNAISKKNNSEKVLKLKSFNEK